MGRLWDQPHERHTASSKKCIGLVMFLITDLRNDEVAIQVN